VFQLRLCCSTEWGCGCRSCRGYIFTEVVTTRLMFDIFLPTHLRTDSQTNYIELCDKWTTPTCTRRLRRSLNWLSRILSSLRYATMPTFIYVHFQKTVPLTINPAARHHSPARHRTLIPRRPSPPPTKPRHRTANNSRSNRLRPPRRVSHDPHARWLRIRNPYSPPQERS
jgi:hypothetical protein